MDAEIDNIWRIRLISTNDGTHIGKLSFPKAVTERRMRGIQAENLSDRFYTRARI